MFYITYYSAEFFTFWKRMKSILYAQICKIVIKQILESIYAGTNGTKYSRMDQVKFVEDSRYKVLFGPFLNTFSLIEVIFVSEEKRQCVAGYWIIFYFYCSC